MPENDDNEVENTNGDATLPVGARCRVGKLSDLKHVRAELGRLYRETRRREGRFPDALTAQRLANVLGSLRTAIEVDELAGRVAAIEERLKLRQGPA